MPSKQAKGKNLMDPSDEVLTGKRQGKGVFETIFDEEFVALKEKQLFARSKPTADVGNERDDVTGVPPVSNTPYGDSHMKKEKDLKPIKDDPYESVVEAFIGLLEKTTHDEDERKADKYDPFELTPPLGYDPDGANFYDPPSRSPSRRKESIIQDDSSKDAKRMGLTHRGGGNYADNTGKITHHTVNGKLTPIVNYQSPPDAYPDRKKVDSGGWMDRRIRVVKYNMETKKAELRQMQKEMEQLLRLKKRDNSY